MKALEIVENSKTIKRMYYWTVGAFIFCCVSFGLSSLIQAIAAIMRLS